MAEYYEMKIAGLDRKLKKCPLNEKLDIAAFIMFGDVEITVESAKQLLAKCPEFDVIITAESKGIPLAYEMARQSCKPYVVARKSVKLYMTDCISATVNSITTAGEQTLYLDGDRAALLKGKRVLIVDDVISTGESLKSTEALVDAAGGNIVARATVLAEGDAAERDDIIFLDPLPLFFKD
ncbi:MAG: adenine phosphoribosyltransferase [Oscillospiraceae bacterium]|nr:adenine phosphoribosyltransferase [Oscillospiraceae bacterium]